MPRSFDYKYEPDMILASDDEGSQYEIEVEREKPFYYKDKYLCDGVWYHEKFPLRWAYQHEEGTGPKDCEGCKQYGFVGETFIGYCVDCADVVYEGECGRGFIGNGKECNEEYAKEYISAFRSYLRGVDVKSIQPLESDDESIEPLPRMEVNLFAG